MTGGIAHRRIIEGSKDNTRAPYSNHPKMSPDLIDAAETFLGKCGLPANEDAVDQLLEAFLPALRIICERSHDPKGGTWRKAGWRAQLYEIRKKTDRMWYRSWLHDVFDHDSPLDNINYNGFYYRQRCEGDPWGEWGEPDSLKDDGMSSIAMGNYKEIGE